jgi:hypothetical protein
MPQYTRRGSSPKSVTTRAAHSNRYQEAHWKIALRLYADTRA